MKISRFIFNPFGENTYVVYDETTRHAAIIDPGMLDEQEEKAIADFLERNHLVLTDMLLTHVHVDHAAGVDFIIKNYGVKMAASAADAPLGLSLPEHAAHFRLRRVTKPVVVERELHAGDVIDLGPDSKLTVIEVPGHSPGGLAFYSEQNGVVFAGDSLFPSSIGRTDLYGGDMETLIRSIKNRLLTLPDETVVLSGHGDETTIGRERKVNPFLK